MRHTGLEGLNRVFGAGAGTMALGFIVLAAATVATAYLRETVIPGL